MTPHDEEDHTTTLHYFAYTFLFLNRLSSNMAQNFCMAKPRALTKPDFEFWPAGAVKNKKRPIFDVFAYNLFIIQPIFFKYGSTFLYGQAACPDEARFLHFGQGAVFAYNLFVFQPIFFKYGSMFLYGQGACSYEARFLNFGQGGRQ